MTSHPAPFSSMNSSTQKVSEIYQPVSGTFNEKVLGIRASKLALLTKNL